MSIASKQLVVIGGGAAGFFCAVNAARMDPALKVVIVEKTNKLLSKVKVSGGGRCNVTHACFDIAEMSRRYPRGQHFVKKAFHRFFTTDTIQWFEERGIQLKTEADGRMFPVTDSSQSIIDCLLKEAGLYGVKVLLHTEVKNIRRENHRFILDISDPGLPAEASAKAGLPTANRQLITDYVCVACGGYPKSSMLDWLKALDCTVEAPVPSLFTFNIPDNPITKLMGVSVPLARVKISGTKLEEEGPLLITHWGLSGPAVLRLSAWGARELAGLRYTFTAMVNWLPQHNEQSLQIECQQLRFDLASRPVIGRCPFNLPQRLWEYLLSQSGIHEGLRWADLPAREQNRLIKNICAQALEVKGKTTFKEEFVTAGGIRLNEVDVQTMMSKKTPNLFFAGEILDVDGITGGYNFQHAWTSGYIAASAITGS